MKETLKHSFISIHLSHPAERRAIRNAEEELLISSGDSFAGNLGVREIMPNDQIFLLGEISIPSLGDSNYAEPEK
jgi:hypothetical protein